MFAELDVQFFEYGDETQMGDGELFKMCSTLCKLPHPQPQIFIFDRDKPDVVNHVMEKDYPYKNWGNNVFSFAIPIPSHRADTGDFALNFITKTKILSVKMETDGDYF